MMTSRHYATPPHPPLRNSVINQPATKRRLSDDLPPFFGQYVPVLPDYYPGPSTPPRSSRAWTPYWERTWKLLRGLGRRVKGFRARDTLDVRLALILLWVYVLWWGQELVFERKVKNCAWGRWETWPQDATPHHVVLIADPQLVDPHTYPGRPWPLSHLTTYYTDLYLRKSFQNIRDALAPDSVLFLGDLFDGGREWSTPPGPGETKSTDKRWTRYGQNDWFREYSRFSRIFIDPWLRGGAAERRLPAGRRLIADLPGNHDLGLGNGIRMPVRKRFNAYFGDGNRIDVIGNHTFVSVDTVSLSAKGQMDPSTGAQMGGEDDARSKAIWSPVDQFLHTAIASKARAIKRQLRVQNGQAESSMLDHVVMDLDDPRSFTIPGETKLESDIPSILLTHVPLYRSPGTPCGPLRERYPPSASAKDGDSPENDDANSIHVEAGVQYQNVLTSAVSDELVELVGDITHVFSGDDHDYCEVVHREYTSKGGGIREITVKSISWAMGVRKPGFLLVSLWNPVDAQGKAIGPDSANPTVQSHLCLLPDQIAIFIRYALLLAFTAVAVLVRSFAVVYRRGPGGKAVDGSYLPLSRMDLSEKKDEGMSFLTRSRGNSQSKSSSSDSPFQNNLAVRANATRSKSPSSTHGYGYDPPVNTAKGHGDRTDVQSWNDIDLADSGPPRTKRGGYGLILETWSSLFQMSSVVCVWYIWLLWSS